MAKLGAFMADGGDPRMMADEKDLDVIGAPGIADYTRPQMRKLHDPNVLFEEYHFYALQTRAEEEEAHRSATAGQPTKGILSTIIPSKSDKGVGMEGRRASLVPNVNTSDASQRQQISDEEWTNASRAVRTAGVGAIFYLITTDILGPFNLPYAFALTGWAPGVVLYTIFGVLAGVSGWLLWQCFMGLDSYQFPLKNYGDMAYRLYGTPFRHMFNILQMIQLTCSVGLIIISSGEALSEVSKFRLCYAVCCLIWALVGFALGQIRTLQRLGWLANFAIWINLLTIFITMGVAAHSDPLFSAYPSAAGTVWDDATVTPVNGVFPPVTHSVGLPAPGEIVPSLNGIAQAVYAYGGAMVFTEFMAEMKRPRDFLKAVWGAQAFIYVCYMLYGLFMYAYQGQYVQTPSYLGINGYAWQTVGNILAIVSALIAATLYGNIGLKVIYNNIFIDLFKAPPLTQRNGKLLWVGLIIIYWAIAFIIGAAIPAFGGFTAVVSAACILPFTYVFPPFLNLAFHIQKNAIRSDEGFDPATGVVTRRDSGMRRLVRGFFAGRRLQVALNMWHIIYFLGALATSALALYSAIESLIDAFKEPQVNAFSCHSPLDSGM